MAGWDSLKDDEDIMYADNVSFDGTNRGGKVTSNGQLLIGADSSPHIRVSTLTAGTGMTITNGEGSITLESTGATPLSFPTDSGTATPAANALTVSGGPGIDTAGSGATITISTSAQQAIPVLGGTVSNLKFTLASGVFTVTGVDASLSATNPAYITMKGNTGGDLITFTLTADQSFNDATSGAGSDIAGNLWNTITTVAYGTEKPFYVYVLVNDDEDTPIFALSDVPHKIASPSATYIGAPDDPVADFDSSMWAFSNIDETLYDDNSTCCIGSIRMTKDTSDDWTVLTLNDSDGVGQFKDGYWMSLPTGQYGASTGTHWFANGGTAPVFSTQEVFWTMASNGIVQVQYNIRSDGGTDGSGAVTAQCCLPQSCGDYTFSNQPSTGHIFTITSTGVSNAFYQAYLQEGTNRFFLASNAGANLTNASFGNGNRYVLGSLTYSASQTVTGF